VQQCVYETKISDIDDLQKRLMQTWFDIEQNVIEAAIDQWRDRLRSCVHAGSGLADTLNTCYEIIVNLHYVVYQNILWNSQCNLVHLMAISLKDEFVFTCIFRCFKFTKVV